MLILLYIVAVYHTPQQPTEDDESVRSLLSKTFKIVIRSTLLNIDVVFKLKNI